MRQVKWLQRGSSEAKFLWDIGKKCGMSFTGGDDEIISKLEELQHRDGSGNGGGTVRANGGLSASNP